jgi:hypothetical protein
MDMQSIKVASRYFGNGSSVGSVVDGGEYDKAERCDTLPGDNIVKLCVPSSSFVGCVCLFV